MPQLAPTSGRDGQRQPPSPLPQQDLQQYIPPELMARLNAARAAGGMVGERRVVTILFCDLQESTALAERLDPEIWADIINGAFERLITPVYRYEGTVARLMGDAILAFFGAPIAHEDDPQRAVLAALDIVEGIQMYRAIVAKKLKQAETRDIATTDLSDLDVRVGINTGLVVVGEFGSDLRLEYTAMGNAVNLAARMEQTAAPGSIQITHDTYRLIAPLLEVEPLGPITVKGQHQPVTAYRVHDLKGNAAQLRGIQGLSAPLIGRATELEVLRRAVAVLQDGRGQIVCLIGEAGLGKSRLITELKTSLPADQWSRSNGPQQGNAPPPALLWLECRGISYDTTQPYGLFQQLIRTLCGVTDQEDPAEVRHRLQQLLDNVPSARPIRAQHMLEMLLSVNEDGDDSGDGNIHSPGTAAASYQEELFAVMFNLWQQLARQTKLVIVFDDLHWADPASVALLLHLFPLADLAAVCFLCAFRPRRQSVAWEAKQVAEATYHHRYHELNLTPLTSDNSGLLVDSLLQIANLPPAVRQIILEKGEGNPFFVEEIVRELIETGAIVRIEENGEVHWRAAGPSTEIAIPDKLQALLTARIDRLEEAVRRTLQVASVIGRSFNYPILQRIADTPELVDQHLLALQRADLIKELTRSPEATYVFRHALTQQAAYDSILLKHRREYHQRVGETMEQWYADRLGEVGPLLAHHFREAGDDRRSLKYYTLAGDRALRLHASAEAVMHYTRALEICLRCGPDLLVGIGSDTPARLYLSRGVAYETLGDFDQARRDHEEALQIARVAGERRAEWRAHLDLGQLWAARNYVTAGQQFQKALQLAREIDDPAMVAHSLNRVGNWLVNRERPQEGRQYHEEALALFRQMDDRTGLAETLDLLALASALGADLATAADLFAQACTLFEELDDQRGLASSKANRAGSGPSYETEILAAILSAEECRREAEAALQIAESIGWRAGQAHILFGLGLHLGLIGNYEGLTSATTGLRLAEEIQHRQWMAASHYTLGNLYWDLFEAETAREHLESSRVLAKEVGSLLWHRLAQAALLRVYVDLGLLDLAAEVRAREGRPEPLMESTGGRNLIGAYAYLALAEGETATALTLIDQLYEAEAGRKAFSKHIPWLLILRAHGYLAQGKIDRAVSTLHDAATGAEVLGSRARLWRIQFLLSEIYESQGQLSEARRYRQKAADLLNVLAETIPEPALRNRFRQRIQTLLIIEDDDVPGRG